MLGCCSEKVLLSLILSAAPFWPQALAQDVINCVEHSAWALVRFMCKKGSYMLVTAIAHYSEDK